MNALAKRIRELRIQAKLSEKALARKCGLAESYIISIETGKKVISEAIAEKILASFGETLVGADAMDLEIPHAPTPQTVKRPEVKKAPIGQPETLEPTEQWASALSGIIATYPITVLGTTQTIGNRELPIIQKKVDGFAPDKLAFFSVPNNDMLAYRMQKGDVVMLHLSKEAPKDGLYCIELGGIKMFRNLKREPGNKWRILKHPTNDPGQVVETSKVSIIGKCLRIEIPLA